MFWWIIGAFGRFWVAFWRPLDLEGVPKACIFWKSKHKMKRGIPQKEVWKNLICWLIFYAKMMAWNCQKKVFALYLLQFKRCRWSRELIENGCRNSIEKTSILKPCVSKDALFRILMEFGKIRPTGAHKSWKNQLWGGMRRQTAMVWGGCRSGVGFYPCNLKERGIYQDQYGA